MITDTLRRPGVVNLMTTAVSQTADLVQTEFRLARTELAEKLGALKSAVAMIALAAVFLICALSLLLNAAVAMLINGGVNPAVAMLLVAVVAGAIGLALFLIGQSRLKPDTLTPERTINSLSRDSRMVKETLT